MDNINLNVCCIKAQSFMLAVIFTYTVITVVLCHTGNNEIYGHEYLMKYGYVSKDGANSGSLRTRDSMRRAIKQFQNMAGLPITGELDEKTIEMMKQPRCGVTDEMGFSNRAKRYALHGSRWSKFDLTYKISKFSSKMPEDQVRAEIDRAFSEWAKVTPLTFTEKTSGDVDIDIKFAREWHGDNNPFDGKGQTLAHAFFPRFGGDAHFDEDEPWTINSFNGVNFFQVAVHEFGHSLGLAHSDVYTALMAPFYKGYQENFQLGNDDVEAVQALYGTPRSRPKTTEAPKPTPKPTKGTRVIPTRRPRPTTRNPVINIPAICRKTGIDAMTRTKDGMTYLFEGKYYYRLNKYGIEKGYPREISADWKGVKGPIDAALTWENGYTYLFKGYYYWKFENKTLIYGPKRISYGFRGVPNNINAAMVWGGNGKTYFFKGNKYWRYSGRRIDYGYPRPISKWRGLPNKIEAAFKWSNGRTYFFTGREYYRYNDQLFSVDATYPRPIATWWLGCPQQGQITQIRSPYSQDQVKTESFNRDEQWITIQDDEQYPGEVRKLDQQENYAPCHHQSTLLSLIFVVLTSILTYII